MRWIWVFLLSLYYLFLMVWGIFCPPSEGKLKLDRINIVLVPGLFGTSRVWLPLKRRLEKLGFNILTPNLGWAVVDIQKFASRLSNFLDKQLKHSEHSEHSEHLQHSNIILIGHSMGGLVILEMQRRFKKFIALDVVTLGTPYGGSKFAYLAAFLKPARQMFPGSHFLTVLREDIAQNSRNLIAVRAQKEIIVPDYSSIPVSYKTNVVPVIGHVSLLFDISDEYIKSLLEGFR